MPAPKWYACDPAKALRPRQCSRHQSRAPSLTRFLCDCCTACRHCRWQALCRLQEAKIYLLHSQQGLQHVHSARLRVSGKRATCRRESGMHCIDSRACASGRGAGALFHRSCCSLMPLPSHMTVAAGTPSQRSPKGSNSTPGNAVPAASAAQPAAASPATPRKPAPLALLCHACRSSLGGVHLPATPVKP
jgi:hypothetical protein